MWNKIQPERESLADDGTALSYRTHVKDLTCRFQIHEPKIQELQILLYQWARNDYVEQVSAAELHKYISYCRSHLAKMLLGAVLLQATTYDPRVLKGKTKDNPMACVTYTWKHQNDLIYGLEWMLATWIWKFNDDPTAECVQNSFDDIASCNQVDLESLWIRPLYSRERPTFGRINWNELWEKHEWRHEGETPKVGERPPPPQPF